MLFFISDYLVVTLQFNYCVVPFFYFIVFSLLLFCISFVSLVLNYQNFLLVLIGLEMILLSLSLLFIFLSLEYLIPIGFIYSLILLALAGVESAIGLCLVINIFFIFKNIDVNTFLYLKG